MLILHLRQYAYCQRTIDKTKYQLQLGAILLFKCHGIRMQLVVMLSAQRQHKEVMRFCTIPPDRGLSGGGDHQRAFHNMHTAVS